MQTVQLSQLQERVLSAAIARLSDKPWYSGIYVSNLPGDAVISQDFDAAVTSVCDETEALDNPHVAEAA